MLPCSRQPECVVGMLCKVLLTLVVTGMSVLCIQDTAKLRQAQHTWLLADQGVEHAACI